MRQSSLLVVPVLLAAAVMFPCLAGWRVLGGADLASIWYPFMEFTRNAFVRDGVVPFWLPSIFGGIPFEESLVPSIYYPTDILAWAAGLNPAQFYALDITLHLALAGTGAALLARAAGAGLPAGTFAGSAYLLSGYLVAVVKSGTLVFIRAAGLYPWIILALLRALRKPTLGRWLALAALLALLPLTASFQPLAYMAVFLPVAALLMAEPGKRVVSVARLGLAGLASAVLAGATLLPAFRYFTLSIRSTANTEWQALDPYPLNFLSIFIPTTAPHWEVKYLGIITAVLAAAGLVRRRKQALPWLVLGILSLLFALGIQTPVGAALAKLPLLGSFRGASHWVALVSLCTAVVSAAGFSGLFGDAGKKSAAALALLLVLNTADLLRQASPLANSHKRTEYEAAGQSRDPLAWFLTQRGGVFRTNTIESHVIANMRAPLGLDWVSGYHGAPLAVFREFYDASMGGCPEVPWLLAWLNTKYFITARNQQMRGLVPLTRFNSLTAGQVWICENPSALPRIFFGRTAETAGDVPVMLRLCSDQPANRRLYVHSPAGSFPAGRLAPGRVVSEKHSPNRVEAVVESGGTGFVFFSEAFYPAWTAFIDGRRTPIHRVNMMFRGVAVEKGRHTIVMSYESIPFKLGLLLSFLGWTLAAAYFLAGRRD
jgi:hypothetical protein